jgi:hypothetical protein
MIHGVELLLKAGQLYSREQKILHSQNKINFFLTQLATDSASSTLVQMVNSLLLHSRFNFFLFLWGVGVGFDSPIGALHPP